MTTLHEVMESRLGQAQAFAFVADFANASRWDPGVATSEAVDAAPVGVGKRYRLGVRQRGRVSPMEYRITEYASPTRVVLVGEGSGVSAVDAITFSPGSNGGTRIDYVAEIRLGGLLRLAQPLLGGTFAKIARDAMDGMKAALDASAAAAAATSATATADSRPRA